MRDEGLERAIKAAGGISALARALGVAQPSISNWTRIPAERVLTVEALTAVPREVLRPDIYPANDSAVEDDAIDQARGRLYVLLANLLMDAPQDRTLSEIARLTGDDSPIGSALAALAEAARGTAIEAVQTEHFNLFVGVGRAELVPYASYYRTGFLYERPLVKVREDLGVLGIERDEGVTDPEDGIGFLCAVMAGMAQKRFAAPQTFQARFFARHLAPWAARFFADLEAAEGAHFYRAVGRLGRIFMDIEREAFALSAATDERGSDRSETLEETYERQAS